MEQSRGFTGGGAGCEQSAKDLFTGKESQLELGLGLSLGGGAAAKGWGEYGRILTAKDFPNGVSSGRAGAGIKRERPASVDDNGAAAAASQVVGWPPIRAFRMNTLSGQTKSSNVEEDKRVDGNEPSEKLKKKVNHGAEKNDVKETRCHLGFVKVNMDGLPIGRKVDLNAHNTYESLANTLGEMFFKSSRGRKELSIQPSKLLDGSSEFVLTYEDKDGDWMLVGDVPWRSEFVLTYEDKDGDWMLVGDVPWRMFINTAKRLRIMRTSEANGLGPKSQDRDEKQKGKPI